MESKPFSIALCAASLAVSSFAGSYSRIDCDASALPAERRFLSDVVASRVEKRTEPSDKAAALKVCFVLDAAIHGENARVSVKDGSATVAAGRFRGLVQGAGALLRSIRYGRETFEAADGEIEFAPKKGLRMAYFARHFHNWYHYASAEELCEYIDDLALAGHNAFKFQCGYPTADRAAEGKDEIRRFLDVSAKAVARVHALDCGFCAGGGSNQAPLDTPEALRGFPNSDPKRGNLGFNVCPSKPEGMEFLCNYRKKQLAELKATGEPVDYFVYWPFDEGGCECDGCKPWGGNGFLKLIEKFDALNKAAFPGVKTIISTWTFHDDDWEGLYRWIEGGGEVDYVLADSHTDFPKYPLEHPVPKDVPVVTFPEISMWGRAPWGGFGATALPHRFERLFRQAERISGGFMHYSEGNYEDVNKAVVVGLYVDPSTDADSILRKYASYEFARANPEDFVRLCALFEENHRFPGRGVFPKFKDVADDDPKLAECRARAAAAREIAARMDAAIAPALSTAWRWRLVYLRALIDVEIFNAKSGAPEPARPYFDELVKIYHAERQLADWRRTGKAGYTTPQYPAAQDGAQAPDFSGVYQSPE